MRAGSWLLWELDEHGESVARAHAPSPDPFESTSHEKGEARLAGDGEEAGLWVAAVAGLGLNRAAMMPQGPVGILKPARNGGGPPRCRQRDGPPSRLGLGL